jgi:glycosyl hydrolase family 76
MAEIEYVPLFEDESQYVRESMPAMSQPRVWLRRMVGGIAIVAAVTAGLEAVPEMPGHAQTALAIELIEADIHAPANPSTAPTYGNLITNFAMPNGLFRNNDGRFDVEYATAWPVSRALDAEYIYALESGETPAYAQFDSNLNATIETYLDRPSPGLPPTYDQGLRSFHFSGDPPLIDDAEWMARLNLVDYDRTHDSDQLRIAEDVFAVALSQWDPNGGGIFWQMQLPDANSHIRAMVSNATTARLGAELYKQTGNPHYLQASEKIDAWVKDTLEYQDGIYADHINPDGSVDHTRFTYNFALEPLAEATLSTVDAQKYSLQDAASQLSHAMAYFRKKHLAGAPSFDSIFAESALYVASLYKQPAFTVQVKKFIDDAITAEPKHPSSLLTFASEVCLQELQSLPENKYRYLFAS